MNRQKKIILISLCFLSAIVVLGQDTYNLQHCLKYALEHNHNLKKSQLDLEKSLESRREIIGALLPQINGSGNMNYNIKKANFVMPNFINDMLPEAAQDPNAPKYMTIEMGTDYSATLGATLNQQIINFSLFNTLEIAKTAENLASLNVEAKEEDIIAQTAGLFYAIQSTTYAAGQFEKSLSLIEKMLHTMEASYENGLVKKVDVDRIKITQINMYTQHSAIRNAVEIQKNLLKLQMGLDMNENINIDSLDFTFFEQPVLNGNKYPFEINRLLAYQILSQQQKIVLLQKKSVIYESLPTLSLGLNYQQNFVSDEFFKGDTYYDYASSMIGFNLRFPIFSGMSKTAKKKGAQIELLKTQEDELQLNQSLTMAYKNALTKLEDNQKTIEAQRENMKMAEEVYQISELNYLQGLASMSDVLNANSSLIQSQISYADALNNYMKAYIELRKATGSIHEFIEK